MWDVLGVVVLVVGSGPLRPQTDPLPITGKYPVILQEPLGQDEMGRIDVMERALARAAGTALPDVTQLLVQGLSDKSRFVRFKAVEFLGTYRDAPDAVPALARMCVAVEREVDELLIPKLYRFEGKGKKWDPTAYTFPSSQVPALNSCVRMSVLALAALGNQRDGLAERELIDKAQRREVARTPAAMVRALGEQLASFHSRRAIEAGIKWARRLEEFLALPEKLRPEPVPLKPFAETTLADGGLATTADQAAIHVALRAAFVRAGIELKSVPKTASGWSELLRNHARSFPVEAPPTSRPEGSRD